MAFFLFLLVNATLFIRPGEIVPSMQGWEVYFYAIVACFAIAIPDVLRYFTGQALDTQPVTLSVFGLLLAILVAPLVAGNMGESLRTGWPFAKVLVYYLLFVSLVNTPARLRMLLLCMLTCCGVVALIAILRYHDVIQLNTIETLKDSLSGRYGETIVVRRLQATGIFQDPNDLCVLLAAMMPIALFFVVNDRSFVLRGLCAGLAPVFGYAIYLTHSRGGFLAFTGGLAALSWSRFGWKKTALLGLVGLPALVVLFAGRQTNISLSAGTAQSRVELWREWLSVFRENPIVGKGMHLAKEEDVLAKKKITIDGMTHLAHNAYLQAFADLGLFGGCLYVGAFLAAAWSIYRFQGAECLFIDRNVKNAQPYVLACLVAYSIGMLTLSINYIIPTYLMLALSVSYTRIARRSCLAPPPPLRFDFFLLSCFGAAGICTLAAIYTFVRFLA